MRDITELKKYSESLVQKILPLLIRKGWFLVTAESLTGGLISSVITEIPGSSQVFKGAVVSYQNSVKADVLSVSSSRLQERGAIDSVVVEQMSEGAVDILGANVAISVSGVAGPGPAEGKSPGTVWINIYTPISSSTIMHTFPGNRQEVRWQTVAESLSLLLSQLEQENNEE